MNAIEMLGPINNASVWSGDELAQRADWLVSLTDDQRTEIIGVTKQLSDEDTLTERFDLTSFPLPTLDPKFADVRKSLNDGSGATLIRGLPLDDLNEANARRMFWGIACHLGTPVSQSSTGERLFSVRDANLPADDPRNRGPMTRKGLTFHSDRCDVIAFLCLHPAKEGGENEVVSTPALYNAILAERPDLLEILQQPFRYQRHNVDLGNQLPYYEQPIFAWHDGHFASFLMQVLIERAYAADGSPDMTALQREALDYLQHRAGELSFTFRQQRGDLVLLNNLVTLHRRSEFIDHESVELRRHILRIWLSMPNSRPLAPAFGPTFGSTQAGAVRGGMKVGT